MCKHIFTFNIIKGFNFFNNIHVKLQARYNEKFYLLLMKL